MNKLVILLIPAVLFLSCDNSTGPKGITCVDIDGNSYEFVTIGDQVWMAENLRTTHYLNGDPIPTGLNDTDWFNHRNSGAFSVYNDDPANSAVYGNLYNWYTIDDERGVCPEGWHVPNYEEFQDLADFLGGNAVAGGALKSTGTIENADGLWSDPNTGATNETGFSALPTGNRAYGGPYTSLGSGTGFWIINQYNNNRGRGAFLHYNNSELRQYWDDKLYGFSVRCIEGPAPEFQSPFTPSNPSPVDGATELDPHSPSGITLAWEGGDPDGDDVTYDVYFEENNPEPVNMVAGGLTVNSFQIPSSLLDVETHYYWKVVSSDGYLTKESPVWEFWTEAD